MTKRMLLLAVLATAPLSLGPIIIQGDGGGAGVTYLLEETFETGSGADNTWNTDDLAPDYDDTLPTIYGTESGKWDYTAARVSAYSAFTANDEVWVAMRWYSDTSITDGTKFLQIRDSSKNELAYVSSETGPELQCGGGGLTNDPNFSWSTDRYYYIMLRYKKGTGANAEVGCWFTDDPSSWGAESSSSTGTQTAQAAQVFIQTAGGDGDFSADEILVDNEAIAAYSSSCGHEGVLTYDNYAAASSTAYMRCVRFTAGCSGTATRVSYWVGGTIGSTNIMVSVYDDDSGDPNNLLSHTGKTGSHSPGAGAMVPLTRDLNSGITITNGNDYHLCFQTDTTGMEYAYRTNAGTGSYSSSETYGSTPPDPCSALSATSREASAILHFD